MRIRALIVALSGSLLLLGSGCGKQASSAAQPERAADADSGGLSTLTAPVPESPTERSPQIIPTPMPKTWTFPGALPANEIEGKQARISTAKGEVVFDFFDKDAPKTVSNFIYLTRGGYFDGLTFHRRVEGFVIQGGDPNGNGTGGPGYRFEDEPVERAYDRGIVAMANSGPDTNGSQFFIMLADTPLPPNYTIFGRVESGMDIVDKIAIGDVMSKVVIEQRH